MTERTSRRSLRLRLACARCQRRKIRCDANFPTCGNCQKASVECIDGDSLRLRDIQNGRTESRLKQRVTWLEAIIRERLPDIDLASDVPSSAGTVEPSDEDTSATSRQETAPLHPVAPPAGRAHEIGLVSVGFNADQRYIGPSSGYFLARFLLGCSPKNDNRQEHIGRAAQAFSQSAINELVDAAHGPQILPPRDQARQLCSVYFEMIHPQYPFIHEPSFDEALNTLYEDSGMPKEEPDPIPCFQVYMILAISSTIISRRFLRHAPGESYCLSALQHFGCIQVENSLQGLQCLLLLTLFTLHSPFMKLNAWYLNYHCIAAVLDLGLQRNITTSSGISLLNQEIRRRVFWTVFTLDRTVATMMGRPIGLRDEACELQLPQNLSDWKLIGIDDQIQEGISTMPYSIHLFKLAKLNSEIKYVANSIVHDAPPYAYPPSTRDGMEAWKQDMLLRLDDWNVSIPQFDSSIYLRTICKIRYHSIRMLLLRPSPAIPAPSTESLTDCYKSACSSIDLFDYLHSQDMLIYDWTSLHGIIFSTITMLYCIRTTQDLAGTVEVDALMSRTSISLSILSASGEHWAAAKRCRRILGDLVKVVISWMKTQRTANRGANGHNRGDVPYLGQSLEDLSSRSIINETTANNLPRFTTNIDVDYTQNVPPSSFLPAGMISEDPFWAQVSNLQFSESGNSNIDEIMGVLFNDFIPQYGHPDSDPFI